MRLLRQQVRQRDQGFKVIRPFREPGAQRRFGVGVAGRFHGR
jgi:hypothetical protein